MELNYDWKSFQSVFYPQKRSLSLPLEDHTSGVIFAVAEKGVIIVAYCENEDLSDWIGTPVETLKASHIHREVVMLSREDLDQWIQNAIGKPHLYEQIDTIRQNAMPQLESKVRNSLRRKACLAENHFLLNTLLGGWKKVLPSAFGVFIRLEKSPEASLPSVELTDRFGARCKEYLEQEQDILILFRGGKLESFYEPDLHSMGQERSTVPSEVVKYLSEKHSVPIQGLVVPCIDWMSWGQAQHPWRMLFKSVQSKNTRLAPFRWKLASLLAVRATFEI